MNIALLNTRITIQRNSTKIDRVGNHTSFWEDYWCCAATVSGECDSEAEEAGTTVDETRADFTIRWCEKTAVITNTAFRVLCNGEIYDILTVDHMNYKHKSVKLKCRKARR